MEAPGERQRIGRCRPGTALNQIRSSACPPTPRVLGLVVLVGATEHSLIARQVVLALGTCPFLEWLACDCVANLVHEDSIRFIAVASSQRLRRHGGLTTVL